MCVHAHLLWRQLPRLNLALHLLLGNLQGECGGVVVVWLRNDGVVVGGRGGAVP